MIKHLRHMLVFNHIVEAGSISKAAEQLNISKSVVSQQLQSLEEALNIELLKRTTRRQVLTPAGKQFHLQCQKIANISNQAWSDAQNSQQLPIGSISISTPHALMDTVVAPAIGALVNQHPKIIPYLQAKDERIHLLEDNIDLAIRIGASLDSEFKQRRIGEFHDQLCLSYRYFDHHPLHEKASESGLSNQENIINNLIKDPLLTQNFDYIANGWQGKQATHLLYDAKENKKLTLQYQPTRFANSINGVLTLMQQGAGVALIPQLLLDQLSTQEKANIIILTTHAKLDSQPIYALHAFTQKTPYVVQLCINSITTQIQQLHQLS